MRTFYTKIVRTWKPSKWLRTIGTILLLASAVTVFVWKPDISWLMMLSYVIYAITFLFALSLSFIQPKDLGEIAISEEKISVDCKGEQRDFLISDLKQLGLDYRGYAHFWKYTIQGNKNHFYFMDQFDNKFDYEIIIQNKEKKEELKQFLKNIKMNSKIKVEQTGHYSF